MRARQFAQHDVMGIAGSDGAFAIANTTAKH
jgi:hypothetical protein